ncbi:yecA family protein [Burkholderiales bacterium JOSHI_001]|nr:yecA family protein [Burkholderiales bacterium JOSHI_001]
MSEPDPTVPDADDDAEHPLDAQQEAFIALCDQLGGFDDAISTEWADGFITGVLAGPRAVAVEEWLPKMAGDAFDRAFGDPTSRNEALAVLREHARVLAMQLDPEALLDEPDALRLTPLVATWSDADRAELVERGVISADEAADALVDGLTWAEGFLDAVQAFAADWPEPVPDTEAGAWFHGCLNQITALTMNRADLAAFVAREHPGEDVSREQLMDEAFFAAQDLRCYWVEHQPKPATRRVEATPGRNDLCPCGSGRKYKKCHGSN